ncbi:putative DNA (cytosine-5)-methyltransferase CMT1 [Cardamine amara subsp. amara]|uniref:Cytosine-specific methyltransferase n=1 Tax=Cardamine amara subsp. amara TaxID=228776 RepID=A0ABD1AHJ7_CARAN
MMTSNTQKLKRAEPDSDLCFTGKPVSVEEARIKWPLRYKSKSRRTARVKKKPKKKKDDDENRQQASSHYEQAMIDGVLVNLGDDVYVMAEEGNPYHIAKIVELFQGIDGEPYFRSQWFYRPNETVIKRLAVYMQEKRVFLSNVEDDNHLNCVHSKVNIAKVPLKITSGIQKRDLPPCDYYYDMIYEMPQLTFSKAFDVPTDSEASSSTISSDHDSNRIENPHKNEKFLLDLYSGCGAMSTGLTMGAALSGIKLVTKWAVDINSFACESVKWNHPETEVRNEAAGDFLTLLKEWKKLSEMFGLIPGSVSQEPVTDVEDEEEGGDQNDEADGNEVFEVEKLVDICFGDPKYLNKPALHFKVRWQGYGEDEDTWEPIDGLGNCEDKLKEFVTKGFKSNLLPLPGSVDFVCGGPPCQGISGHNRYRNKEQPLEDVRNQQMLVYMDIIDFLKPKYVLMENVVDLLKFSDGFLGRYAVARLVAMNYQTRVGMMIAGSYGLPQVRNRVFIWGAQPTEKLPPYPLPTHKVLNKCPIPIEFKKVLSGHGLDLETLEEGLTLADAISDLPQVTNWEENDEMHYNEAGPKTDFQKFIRLKRSETLIPKDGGEDSDEPILYDHQPLVLSDDDFERLQYIPKKKGANFRDMPGLYLDEKKQVQFNPLVERIKLKSGKFVVPDYAMSYVNRKSKRPFGRTWWDDIVNTVVTRAEPHNQIIIHPLQDRVLTVRENARLQGFPDFYKLFGPVKEKYIQVGNAVAVPVGVALGYAFGMASQGLTDDQPVIKLPFKFPECMLANAEDEAVAEDHSD